MAKGRKTFVDDKGKRRHTTKWQELVSKYGMEGAKKHYAGYKQRPSPPTTTGNVRDVKGGTRRVKNTHIGRGKRNVLYYKGDKVGTWTKSGGNTTKGRSGLSWYMERGYGTPRKPVPDTKLTRRLGIAGKGREGKGKMLTPGAVAGLNEEEEWEIESHKRAGKAIAEAEGVPSGDWGSVNPDEANSDYQWEWRNAEEGQELTPDGPVPTPSPDEADQDYMWDWRNAEEFDAELTMWQEAVKEHGIPPKSRSKGHGHPAFKAYRGRKQKDGVMSVHGDKTSVWTPSGGYSTKGVNTGRGWFMERGYGTPRKPVPDTELTRRLGIAGAGKQQRGAGGLFGRMKRMLVPSVSGINQKEDWEIDYAKRRGLPFFEAENYWVPMSAEEFDTFSAQNYGRRQRFGNRYVARNSQGEFISNVGVGRSLRQDRAKDAKHTSKPGFGQMGDVR
tara:strand:- start:1421 stop:2752 length:1332 start_codon:yes stop_codon:yes gene_type:complete